MKCLRCGAENKAGKKFCVKCGAPLELKCPKCQAAYDAGDRFCGECGNLLTDIQPITPVISPKLEEVPAQTGRIHLSRAAKIFEALETRCYLEWTKEELANLESS